MQKDTLRAMVTSKEWTLSVYARESKGKKFVDLVLDSIFWKEFATIVHVTESLVRVLKLVDSDERPFMGYLYAAYQYNSLDISNRKHTTSGLLDVIERYSYGNPILMSNLTREMKLFCKVESGFGRVSAIKDRDVMLPGRNYDPIDFEEFGTNDTWVSEDEPPNLTEDEMETFRKELAACTIQGGQENNETLNLVELDTGEEDENNDGDNIGGTNETFNVNGVQDHGRTEFNAS
ncbi:hypothetical protein ACH5RR_011287 [Cinchona calisaya]|uniref:Uncharacterized protein n=1 Tax=Cinchona calisaya TaxID=153742 RepID=A0ABD3A6X5_9GENT